jgi:Secretion system C-terminal sorting domain/CotH kinase protein
MMEDISYRSVFISRCKELRKGAFCTDSVMMFLDNTIELLGEAIARNFEKWPVIGIYVWPNYFVGNSFEEEMDYLTGWLTDRIDWIDASIMLAGDSDGNASNEGILIFPNPVSDRMNLYFYSTGFGKVRIELFDLLGQKVLNREIAPSGWGLQYLDLDIYRVRSGYYILKASQGERLIGKKNIIVRNR